MVVCVFQDICSFCLICQIHVLFFLTFPYYSSVACMIYSDIACFIPDISDLCSLFPLTVLLEFISFINLFREHTFFHWFSLFSAFNFIDLSSLCLSFVCIEFIFSSFSKSLRYKLILLI